MTVIHQGKRCSKCGCYNSPNAKFCGHCGRKLKSNKLTKGLLFILCVVAIICAVGVGTFIWKENFNSNGVKESHMQYPEMATESMQVSLTDDFVHSQYIEKNTISAYYSDLIAIQNDGSVRSNNEGLDLSGFQGVVSVAMGDEYALGIRPDGTVALATSEEFYWEGFDGVSNWTDIIAVAAGYSHAIGLKADGTVVAAGDNIWGQCDVSEWTDIVAIDVSWDYPRTFGVKEDGTIVACGRASTEYFADWSDVIDIEHGRVHTIAVKTDGTVKCEYTYGMEDTSRWTDIISVSTGSDIVAGLKSDGTVVAAGDNHYGQCDVSGWTDVVAVELGSDFTVGLKSDGTVVHAGTWRNDLSRVLEDVRLPE